jgi:hypothetical protein
MNYSTRNQAAFYNYKKIRARTALNKPTCSMVEISCLGYQRGNIRLEEQYL